MPIINHDTTRSLAVPFLPRPATKDPEVSRWGNDLTLALSRAFDTLATRIEELSGTDKDGSGTLRMPAANRSRNFFYDGAIGDLYFDNGAWQLVASLKAGDHSVDTVAFGGILTVAEVTVQKALDKIDDHKHDGDYISIIATPAANHFPYQTAGGELVDSGYDAADFSAAGHNHDADYVDVDGDTMTGNLGLNNNIAVTGKETGGTVRNIAKVNASNEVELGNDTTDTQLKGENIYLGDKVKLAAGGRLTFEDGFLYASNGVTFGGLMGFATDRFTMNSAGWECYAPQHITFANAKGVKGYNAADATAYDLLKLDASDDLIIGNATTDTKLYGNPITSVSLHKFGDIGGGNTTELQTDGDLIQAGTAKIETAASMKANNTWGSDLQATKSKALANNVGGNFFKWGSGAAAGASMHYRVEFLIQVQYTFGGTTYYWTRGGSINGTIQHLAANLCKGIAGAVVWDGAAISFSAAGGSNAPSMGEAVTMATSVAAADLGPSFLVNLTGIGYAFVSGYVHYTVLSTDVNHTAWTAAFV